MLRLSTKGQYGVRAMYEIARNHGKGPVTIKNISERQKVSIPYLEQILNKLRKNGLIQSVRGPGGGYVLSKGPEQIKIGEILSTLEGPVAISTCLDPSARSEECTMVDICVTRLMWKRLGDKIEEFLNETTLADLIYR
ncbi:MAG: RrF2 family transcriptional regulator [Nitrospirota bacterium]